MNIIKVLIKNEYGNRRVYPICNTGRKFAYLTKSKTLDKPQREMIKSLGYDFEVMPEKLGENL